MNRVKLLPLAAIAAALTLTACEARFGNDAAPSNGSAEGKSEDGRLSISTNGFEMKIDIPESLRRGAEIDDDSQVIYPNSRMSGIHVEGGRAENEGEVELRFTTGDAPATVAAWYRDPARAADFTIGRASREGNDILIEGARKEDNGRFRIRLTARPGGGTDGRALLSEAG